MSGGDDGGGAVRSPDALRQSVVHEVWEEDPRTRLRMVQRLLDAHDKGAGDERRGDSAAHPHGSAVDAIEFERELRERRIKRPSRTRRAPSCWQGARRAGALGGRATRRRTRAGGRRRATGRASSTSGRPRARCTPTTRGSRTRGSCGVILACSRAPGGGTAGAGRRSAAASAVRPGRPRGPRSGRPSSSASRAPSWRESPRAKARSQPAPNCLCVCAGCCCGGAVGAARRRGRPRRHGALLCQELPARGAGRRGAGVG